MQVPSSPYFPAYAQGQGPPPMVQERFQSVISQLFQHVRSTHWCNVFLFVVAKLGEFCGASDSLLTLVLLI